MGLLLGSPSYNPPQYLLLTWDFIPSCLGMWPLFALQNGRESPRDIDNHLWLKEASWLPGNGKAKVFGDQKGRAAKLSQDLVWNR